MPDPSMSGWLAGRVSTAKIALAGAAIVRATDTGWLVLSLMGWLPSSKRLGTRKTPGPKVFHRRHTHLIHVEA